MPAAHSPDPAKGVFETILVLDGRAIELEAHLRRLDASLSALFGARLPSDAKQGVVDRARAVRRGKLRLTVVPSARSLATTISTAEVARPLLFPPRENGVALRSIVVAGGLGAHKWADRTLLEAAEAAAPTTVPLLLDRNGQVLEAARGSVFSVREGRLLTPPADGRILPGIARRRVIEVAMGEGIETSEEAFTPANLRAGEAFLAGSVRGVEPVRSVDGLDVPAGEGIGVRIATGLKRRWLPIPRAGSAATVAIGRRDGRRAR